MLPLETCTPLPQGTGREPLAWLVEAVCPAPDELVLVGDIGGHVVWFDGGEEVACPTEKGELPACVRARRFLAWDHHYRARLVAMQAGYENAAAMAWAQRWPLAARLREHGDGPLRVVTQGPPDLDSLACLAVFAEAREVAAGRRSGFRAGVGDLATRHARNADLGNFGPLAAPADRTFEGAVEALHGASAEPVGQVAAGLRLLEAWLELGGEKAVAVPRVAERLAGVHLRLGEADARLLTRARAGVEDLEDALGGGPDGAPRHVGRLAPARRLSVHAAAVPGQGGAWCSTRLVAAELRAANPISKLVQHSAARAGAGMTLLHGSAPEGFNLFGALRADLAASLEGFLAPEVERWGWDDGMAYGYQIVAGHLPPGEDVHALAAELAARGRAAAGR